MRPISMRLVGFLMAAWLAGSAGAIPVTDGLIIHLRADDLALNDGDPVTMWPDSDTFYNTLDGTLRAYSDYGVPTFITNAYNHLPAVRFDRPLDVSGSPNSDKQLLLSGQWSWDQTQGVTLFMVCQGGLSTNKQRVLQIGKSGGTAGKVMGVDVNSDQSQANDVGVGARYNNGWTCTATAGPNPVQQGVWHVSVHRMAQGTAYGDLFLAVNELPPLAMISNQPSRVIAFDAGGNDLVVGAGWQNNGLLDWYEGDVAEVVVYNSQLSDDAVQQVLDFLKNKYAELTAHNPSPAHKAVDQGAFVDGVLQTTLNWSTGLDPADSQIPRSEITGHYLYLAENDPNFVDAPIAIPAGTPVQAVGTYGPITLKTDATYYWRVDESVNGSGPDDPNTIMGPVWSFDALKSVPIITVQPTSQAVFPGQPAALTIEVDSISSTEYAWYKSDDAVADEGDTLVGEEATLSLADVQVGDQGYYYCSVTNASGSENAVVSDVVMLGVKRNVGHWTLNLADYVEGQYRDSSGEGHHAEPNLLPDASQFVDGADPTETGQGLDLTARPLSAARTADAFAPAAFTGEVTISAWVNWAGPNDAWQGVVCSRRSAVDPEGNLVNFLLEIRNNNGNLQVNSPYFSALQSANLPIGQWTHVAATIGSSGIRIYFDGQLVAERTGAQAVQQNVVPLYLGANNRDETGLISTLSGILDDVRIFNYEMNTYEIVDLYFDVSETPQCLNPGGLDMRFDVAGGGLDGNEPDCHINMVDFAVFAGDWLNCGLYPSADCQ